MSSPQPLSKSSLILTRQIQITDALLLTVYIHPSLYFGFVASSSVLKAMEVLKFPTNQWIYPPIVHSVSVYSSGG